MNSSQTLKPLGDVDIEGASRRRRFAARRQHVKVGWGVIALAIGIMAFCTIGGLHSIDNSVGEADAALKALFFFLPGLAGFVLLGVGVYLLRGRKSGS